MALNRPHQNQLTSMSGIESLAYSYYCFGFYDISRPLYEGLIEIKPRVAAYHIGLGLCCRRLNIPGAYAQFQIAAQVAPKHPVPLISLAEETLTTGDTQTALDWLYKAKNLSTEKSAISNKTQALHRLITEKSR